MIFSNVKKLQSGSDKEFFEELIEVYCRLVEVYCEKHRKNLFVSCEDINVVDELKSIGVIQDADEMVLLKAVLCEKYDRFINCVNYYASHKVEIGDLLDNLNNEKREELQRRATGPTVADFFCGAGGLSLGFIQNGFRIALANDIEDVCIQTYKYNHPEVSTRQVIQGDIKNIVDDIDKYISEDIDIVIGGPPCQGFSEANRQRIINDPRNLLYKYYIQAVTRIVPKIVLMENVKGMLKVADQVVEDYENIDAVKGGIHYSYKASYRILNSQNFGVAQSRERLIYLAIRNDVMEKNAITPEGIFEKIVKENTIKEPHKLSEALQDIKPLQAPRIKNQNEIDSEKCGKKIDVNDYENHNNKYLDLINTGRKIPYIYNHKARYVSDLNYEIYRKLDQGDDATDEKIKDIMPYAHRNHCFKDKYYKLIADRPCRTITAHLRMDCHSHIHPYQIRSLTPREAARVQSFPDDYLFLGAYLKTYMQIGNAVPPMMARGIAKTLKKYIGETADENNTIDKKSE